VPYQAWGKIGKVRTMNPKEVLSSISSNNIFGGFRVGT
jgi:hypothetical protein